MDVDLVKVIQQFEPRDRYFDEVSRANGIYKTLTPKETKNRLDGAYENGLIRKEALENGAIYVGKCRNSNFAIWSSTDSEFIYMREKFGETFPETAPHPTEDKGFDVFVPVKKVGPV